MSQFRRVGNEKVAPFSNYIVVINRKVYKVAIYSNITMKEPRDYSKLMYVGIDKSFSASLNHPGDLVLQFAEVKPEGVRLEGILYDRNLVSVPMSEFDRQFRELGEKVLRMQSDWKYRNIINFDTTELDEARQQYAVIESIAEQVRGSFKPVETR